MFESYCAVANGQKLHVAMSETDEKEFIDAITDDLDAIYEPYKKIDASKAACWVPAEKKGTLADDELMLKGYVESIHGKYHTIEESAFEGIRRWMITTMDEELALFRSNMEGRQGASGAETSLPGKTSKVVEVERNLLN